MARLILIRHGQSLWNAENKFTGWVDSPLSKRGELEAKKAGKYIKENNIIINSSYTSLLTRAISTLKIVLLESNMANIEIIKTWQLNERHYGSLTGQIKSEVKKKLGDNLFLKYRRSWDVAPPAISSEDPNIKSYSKLNNLIPKIAKAIKIIPNK